MESKGSVFISEDYIINDLCTHRDCNNRENQEFHSSVTQVPPASWGPRVVRHSFDIKVGSVSTRLHPLLDHTCYISREYTHRQHTRCLEEKLFHKLDNESISLSMCNKKTFPQSRKGQLLWALSNMRCKWQTFLFNGFVSNKKFYFVWSFARTFCRKNPLLPLYQPIRKVVIPW